MDFYTDKKGQHNLFEVKKKYNASVAMKYGSIIE